MLCSVGEPDHVDELRCQLPISSTIAPSGQFHHQFHVLFRGQSRDQIVGLKDEAYVADLKAERACSFETDKSNPKTLTSPSEGFSSPAIRLRTVVLPAPDGPMMAATSPSLTLRVIEARALTCFPFTRYSLDTPTKSTASAGALSSISSS